MRFPTHVLHSSQSRHTFKFLFYYCSLQRKLFQNITSARDRKMSHKTFSAEKLRMFSSGASLNAHFENTGTSCILYWLQHQCTEI